MRRLATLALLLVVASIARAAEPPPPGLGHDHPLTGRIWNVAQGRFVAMTAVAAAVSAARFALLGERHDHPEHHEFQAWLLRRMLESGRRPAVAFEMLDTTQAPALARHLATSPRDAAGLGDAVGWRASGWPEWRLYQPIAEIALAAGLPVVAANLPATAARAVARGDLAARDPALVRRHALHRAAPAPAAPGAEIRAAHGGARRGAARLAFLCVWLAARADRVDQCARARARARAPSDGHSPADCGAPRARIPFARSSRSAASLGRPARRSISAQSSSA